jgi:hypothetical protein
MNNDMMQNYWKIRDMQAHVKSLENMMLEAEIAWLIEQESINDDEMLEIDYGGA